MKHYIDYSNEFYMDQIFISYKNSQITFSEFYDNICITSRAFTKLNLTNNQLVGILLSNPLDILDIYFSCIQLNKTPVIIPSDITNYQLQEIINSHKINFIISEWLRKKQINETNNCDFFYIQDLSSNYGGCGSISLNSDIENQNNIQSFHLTSGSTGLPKLIPLSFNNFISSVEQWDKELKFSRFDKYIQCLPLNHIAGLSIIMRSQIKGFEVILMNKFDSHQINFEIDNGATFISLIPSMLKKLLDSRSGRPFPRHFRGVIIGGDTSPRAIIQEALDYGVPIYKTYGMTETCSGISGFWVNENKSMLNSVGKAFSHTKINISDSKIAIEGPSVTPLYDNIINTKDFGFLKKKFLFINGRTDDMVIISGENVSLSQIKNILLNHDNIMDVYLVDEKDEHYGTKVTAYIEINNNQLTKNDIVNYCQDYLSKNQCPHDIQIVEKINHD